jgi:uncharacterized protein YjbI with pentapeptide repeats
MEQEIGSMAKLTREQVEQIVKEAWEREVRPDLRGADLRMVNLSEANLSKANLSKANLGRAKLFGAILSGADLSEANLSRAKLFGADLSRADLSKAHLIRANLSMKQLCVIKGHLINLEDLIGANLIGVNLSGAEVHATNFGTIDLSQVKGLDRVKHKGPSTIGTDTLQLFKGQIPKIFLRGCGLSDWEIENAKLYRPNLTSDEFTTITYKLHDLLVGQAIQYYSCFISYSHHDEEFAQQLYDDLQENGVRCWFAPEKMKIGDKIRQINIPFFLPL